MKKYTKLIIVALLIILIFIPVISEAIKNNGLKNITYEEYENLLSAEDDTWAMVYLDTKGSNNYKTMKKIINESRKESGYKAYFLDYASLTEEQKKSLSEEYNVNETSYLFIEDGEVEGTESGTLATDNLEALIKTYYLNEDLSQYYKVFNNAEEFEAKANGKETIMVVFGRESCYYCGEYKPIYNAIAKENEGIDIYYFDSDNYDATEYRKAIALDYEIPAYSTTDPERACSSTKKSSSISAGFGTPLTLFIKKGKTVDCISGYVDKDTVLKYLTANKMIKSEDK